MYYNSSHVLQSRDDDHQHDYGFSFQPATVYSNKMRLYDSDLGELQELYFSSTDKFLHKKKAPKSLMLLEQGIIEENYDKLKGLKRDMGEEVYKAVTTALTEINDYNPRDVFLGSTLSDHVMRFNNIPQNLVVEMSIPTYIISTISDDRDHQVFHFSKDTIPVSKENTPPPPDPPLVRDIKR
ncbi:putative domain XH, partial [Cynara cardunculus var. scolymus]